MKVRSPRRQKMEHKGADLGSDVWHPKDHAGVDDSSSLALRTPAEPTFPPIQEPNDPPDNPDVPVREPEPDDPGQI